MPPDRPSFGQNSFQLIRLLLAVAVLYRHSFDLLASGHADVVLDLIPPRTHLGRIALCFFMVVSGFLVTHSWFQSNGWCDFLWRRVLRVYPAFVVASVFSAFVAAPLGSTNPGGYLDSLDLGRFLLDVAQLNKLSVPPSFLANPFPGPINGSLWSIKIEFECYLALMALGLVGALRWRAGMLGLFALLLVGHAVQGYVPSRLDRFANHVQLATFFLAGCVFYLYRDRIRWSFGWLEVAALATVVTAILEVGFVELLPISGTYILLYLAYEPRLLKLRVARRVDLSYGIYLYAWPLQQLIVQAFGPALNPYTLSLLALAASAGFAWLSSCFVERPFLRLKQAPRRRRETRCDRDSPVASRPSAVAWRLHLVADRAAADRLRGRLQPSGAPFAMVIVPESPASTAHPLDSLSAAEITEAVAIVRAGRTLGPRTRFVSVSLREPTRRELRLFRQGVALERLAEVVLLDNDTGLTSEAVVSLTRGSIATWRDISGVQPAVMLDEFYECEVMVKADPTWQAAVRKRGVTDFDLCMVDPWSNGHYGAAEDSQQRLIRALTWVRTSPLDNGYARPIENLITVVDLNAMQVVRIEDGEVVALPPTDANYTEEAVGTVRTDVKPIEIVQPNGPSFALQGNELAWQKWRMRIGFNAREGLVLYGITYQDGDRERSILERASLCDMVVPYGDPRPHYNRRNAFDVGEYGVGVYVNSLELGCDCLGEIRYLDACLNDSKGNSVPIANAICLHEEDVGILWKHVDIRAGTTEVRRSRRMVVSFIATVGNYEYGFYWYFYQDGTIQYEIKMSGVLSNGTLPEGESAPIWGTEVAPRVYAPIHQHFFNVRLDVAVDGPKNRVEEVHTVADAAGPENPLKNGFHEVSEPLTRESEAQRVIDPLSGRYWRITSPDNLNAYGRPTAYRLVPGDNVLPFAAPDSPIMQRAAFMGKHVWVTQYDPAERYATGDYPNQHPGGAGLPSYVAQDRALDDEELVVWYSFGAHHVARPEDWPVMPVTSIGFSLRPSGFFDRSPALDVPRPMSAHCAAEHSTNGTNGTA